MPYSPEQKSKFRKKYYAQQSILTAPEKRLISFYELKWALEKIVPTVEEVVKYVQKEYPKSNHISVNYYLTRPPVVKALKDRGIPWEKHSQLELTPTQIATASLIMNFSDTRTKADKLAALGVNPTQYQAWLNDPKFQQLLNSLKDDNIKNIEADAVTNLGQAVNRGDMSAIKFYMESVGTLKGESQQDSTQLLIAVIEILQKHVKDPNILNAIAQDIALASANKQLQRSVNVDAEYYTQEEIQSARRQLGV